MGFYHSTATVFVPDGKEIIEAYRRTTHLGIGAHSDDLEIMAFHGIRTCYDDRDNWFGGITCTDGSGSARSGRYASLSNDEMIVVRKNEQDKAAALGKYSFVAQLDFTSAEAKDPEHRGLEEDLSAILAIARPSVVYTHNPADKHESHIGVLVSVIRALRRIPEDIRPKTTYGCEVWRDLDWMLDEDKIALDSSDPTGLGKALVDVFDSQIAGGKRYDLAAFGRQRANATFFDSHGIDGPDQLVFAMDLSPLIADDSMDMVDYVMTYINRFQQDVKSRLKQQLGMI